jgi:hypothetical protein
MTIAIADMLMHLANGLINAVAVVVIVIMAFELFDD